MAELADATDSKSVGPTLRAGSTPAAGTIFIQGKQLMKLIKTPTKGMNDYLPGETALREYVKNIIVEGYAASGFSRIETPSVEHIENLTGKNGGDNEKLIFRIMKRGEELARAEESGM